MRSIIIHEIGILLLTVSIFCSGCDTINQFAGVPTKPSSPVKDKIAADLTADYTKNIASKKEAYDKETDSSKKEHLRDQILDDIIVISDTEYNAYVDRLRNNVVLKDAFIDIANLALTGTAALVGNASTKAVLAGIAAFASGANSSYNKDVLKDKAIDALINVMDTARSNAKKKLNDGMILSDDKYSLNDGLRDINELADAANLSRAILTLQAQTGQNSQVAIKQAVDAHSLYLQTQVKLVQIQLDSEIQSQLQKQLQLQKELQDQRAHQ